MRNAFILGFLANVVVTLASLAILPDRVAVHFGLGGAPDGWASSLSSTLMMLAMHALMFCTLYFSPRLIAKVPSKWISLPNRGFWLTPEHRSEAVEKFSHHIWQFGAVLFLFMLVTSLLTIRANLSELVRLDEGLFLTALALFLAFTVYWIVALVRAFRVPQQT